MAMTHLVFSEFNE